MGGLLVSYGSWIAWAFAAMCVAAAALYAICHGRPRLLASYVSVPYVFQAKWNVGARAFDLQTVLYAAFHGSAFDDACHHFLTLDQIAWAVLAHAVGGVPALAALGVLVVAQVATFGERALVAAIAIAWALFGAAAVGLHAAVGASAVVAAEVVLLASALLRALGHIAEPLPPLVGDDSLRFTPFRVQARHPITGLVGWVAEFSAGLPFRLYASQLHLLGQRLGLRPRRARRLEEVRALAARLHREGWASWSVTRALFAWHPSCPPTAPGERIEP